MATNTITRLYQGQLTASAANLVTATSAGSMIKQINIINQSGVSQTVELFIGTTGTSAVANQVYKATLASGDYAVFEGIMVVPTTLFLTGKTTSVAGSGVTVTIHGMDMT
jgi:hypothetical protein